MLMDIEITQRLMIHTIDPLQLLSFDLELYPRLSHIPIKPPLEVSRVDHQLIILLRLLLQLPLQ